MNLFVVLCMSILRIMNLFLVGLCIKFYYSRLIMYELFLSSILFLMDAHAVYEYNFSYTCNFIELSYGACSIYDFLSS